MVSLLRLLDLLKSLGAESAWSTRQRRLVEGAVDSVGHTSLARWYLGALYLADLTSVA